MSSGKFSWKRDWEFDDRKPCSRCSVVKMLDEFAASSSGYMGHDAMCRECHREQVALSYRPKRKNAKPSANALLSDNLINAYGKMLFLDGDEGPSCLNVPDKQKDIWFAPHNTWENLVAKGYCHTCPVFEACLDLTVLVKPPSGVWAGLNPADRRFAGVGNKEALRAEFDYQKTNGAYMSSYLKTRKQYVRWDRSNEEAED